MSRQSNATRLLVADDQPDVLEALRYLLHDRYDVDFTTTAAAVIDAISRERYELLLLDLNYARDTTSGSEGLELLARVREIDSNLPVVVMTGWGTIDTAVEAMRRGARSFVQKPWENRTLIEIIERELEAGRAANRRDALRRREEEDARLIQRGLLPITVPEMQGYGVSGGWRPAGDLGGDCYDVLDLASGQIGISIADVCGKGVSAALLMSNLQAAVRAFAQDAAQPQAVCASVNRLLCRNMIRGRFVTFCYVRVDTARRIMTCTVAGHNPPILMRAAGQVFRPGTGGIVLGVFPDARYEEETLSLAPGDRLVLFTDGITEATGATGDEYGDDRLVDSVRRHRHLAAAALQQQLFADVLAFAPGGFQDDATIIVLSVDNSP